MRASWGRAAGAAALLTVHAPALAQDAETALARADSAYRRISTLRAGFHQTIENPMLGGPETARGTIFLEPPSRFGMRFTDPAGDRIVADGRWLWAFAPSSIPDQVIRQPIPESGAATPNLIAQFVERPLERYRATYRGTDAVGGHDVDLVELVPLAAGFPFRRATIAVARRDGLLRRIDVIEESGQRRTLVFDAISVNAAIPRAEFEFVVPKGVRVVTP